LLLIATAESAGSSRHRRGLDVQAVDPVAGKRPLLAEADEMAGRDGSYRRHGHILGDTVERHDALGAPLTRDISDTQRASLPGRVDGHRAIVEENAAAGDALEPGQASDDRFAPGPDDPGDAQHIAFVQLEGYVAELA